MRFMVNTLIKTVGALAVCGLMFYLGARTAMWLDQGSSDDLRYVSEPIDVSASNVNSQQQSPAKQDLGALTPEGAALGSSHELTDEDLKRCSVALKNQHFPGPVDVPAEVQTDEKASRSEVAAKAGQKPQIAEPVLEHHYSDVQLLQCVRTLDQLAAGSDPILASK